MTKKVLFGNEAVALGAIEAKLTAAYGYPGTPSTEIMEFLQKWQSGRGNEYTAFWCSNEKTALESALGVSMMGKRSLVTMKHVGLNVAADPLMTAANIKTGGGLVLAVADDPGMHSSQNEQDSRFFADFANIICLEPSNQLQAYLMTMEAFEVSEKFQMPVILRMVTRLAHSAMTVTMDNENKMSDVKAAKFERRNWLSLPTNARRLYKERLGNREKYVAYSENSRFNGLSENNALLKEYGVITSGIARNYFEENFLQLSEKPAHLHIGIYPLPTKKIIDFAQKFTKIVVLEEGFPFLEKALKAMLPERMAIIGRESGHIPNSGELTGDSVRKALALPERKALYTADESLPPRPPRLCTGCPHADTFKAINMIRKEYPNAIVTSDIGCYSLGALPPISAIDSIVCMGASIGMAIGAAQAGAEPVIAVIGDSTFIHSGLPALADALHKKSNINIVIMDNSAVAMTGGQATTVSSERLRELVLGMGVARERIKKLIPLPKNLQENVKTLKEEMAVKGISVIIFSRKCLWT